MGKRFGQELQGDEPGEFGVLGLVDHAHAPSTKLLENPVVRNGLAQHGRQLASRGELAYIIPVWPNDEAGCLLGASALTEARCETEPEGLACLGKGYVSAQVLERGKLA